MTGTAGCRCFTVCSSSSPESPGMRISETRTSGALPESASSASCAEENELKAMPSRLSAFSITQRLHRSDDERTCNGGRRQRGPEEADALLDAPGDVGRER